MVSYGYGDGIWSRFEIAYSQAKGYTQTIGSQRMLVIEKRLLFNIFPLEFCS